MTDLPETHPLVQYSSGQITRQVAIRRSFDPSSISVEDILTAQSNAIICADAGVWRHVDLDSVWRLSTRSVEGELPDRCPLTIEQLLSDDFDIQAAIASLRL